MNQPKKLEQLSKLSRKALAPFFAIILALNACKQGPAPAPKSPVDKTSPTSVDKSPKPFMAEPTNPSGLYVQKGIESIVNQNDLDSIIAGNITLFDSLPDGFSQEITSEGVTYTLAKNNGVVTIANSGRNILKWSKKSGQGYPSGTLADGLSGKIQAAIKENITLPE